MPSTTASDAGAARESATLAGFRADYQKVFVKPWSPYLGAIVLMLVILALMVSGQVWGVFGGVRFWGDWINHLIGLGPLLGLPAELNGLLHHRMSLMNGPLDPRAPVPDRRNGRSFFSGHPPPARRSASSPCPIDLRPSAQAGRR